MDLKIVSARELTLWKRFFKRAVITETWSDVSPFGDEGLEGCAAHGVAADGHRSEGAAMIALPARKNPIAFLLAIFKMKLARKFYGGFCRFGATGSEIDAATVAKILRSHREQALGKSFRRSRVKLRSVRESDPGRLLRHRAADFPHAVTDADDCSLSGSVKESTAIGGDNPASFLTSGDGKGLLKMAGQKAAAGRHELSGEGL